MFDIDFDISPESRAVVICGEDKDPHHEFHTLKGFVALEEVRTFAEKSRDGRSAKEWLDWWLDQKLPSIGNISPKEAILAGDFKLVMLRVRQSLRISKRLRR